MVYEMCYYLRFRHDIYWLGIFGIFGILWFGDSIAKPARRTEYQKIVTKQYVKSSLVLAVGDSIAKTNNSGNTKNIMYTSLASEKNVSGKSFV